MDRQHLSRIFRCSFPELEDTSFRTDAWRDGTAKREVVPLHPTLPHAFAMAAKLEESIGITLVPEDDDQPEQHKSYRELYHLARSMAGALAELGVRKGDRVLVVLPTGFEFVCSFFAIQLVGAVPVPSYPPAALEKAELALERMAHVAKAADAWWCVSDRTVKPLLGALALQVPQLRSVVTVEHLAGGDPARAPKARISGGDLAFLQYTSGSTGWPKGAALAQENVVANIHVTGQGGQMNRRDVVVSWLPLYHDMGLIGGLLTAIYWRMPLVLMAPTTFLMRPVRWLRAIHRHRGTISMAPNFGYAMCLKRVRPQEREGLDLSSWRVALNGAEQVSLRVIQEFERTYGPLGFRQGVMMPVYGLAEMCVGVSFPTPGDPIIHERLDRASVAAGHARPGSGDGAMDLVSVGRVLPGHQLRVVDENGQPLPPREVGHIIVSGPSLMRGYYNNPDATAKVIRDGWLWTGDLGYMVGDRLFMTGRAKDLVIVRGHNYYPEDLEHQIEAVEGVRPGGSAVFGVYDEAKATELVVVVCETKVKGDEARMALVEAVTRAMLREANVGVDEVVLVEPGTIPRTSSGKRQRALCRQLYLEDKLTKRVTGKLQLMGIFVRSGAGFLVTSAKRLLAKQREPD